MAPRARKQQLSKSSPRKKTVSNESIYWKTYRDLQKKVDKAWDKLQMDVKRKAPANVLIRNKNQLLLLLGECNYMARECMRCTNPPK